MSTINDKDPTSTLFDACNTLSKIATDPTPLFIDGKPSTDAAKTIWQAVQSVRTSNPSKPSSYLFSHLPTEQKLVEFFIEMNKLPESEKQFMILPATASFPHLNTLLSKTGLNGFYKCKDGEVVPSFGMMQTLLKVKYNIEPHLDPTYITAPQDSSKQTINRPMLARLQLAYAMLIASSPDPKTALKNLIASVPMTQAMRDDIDIAFKQMPNDPLLKLLVEIKTDLPSSKL